MGKIDNKDYVNNVIYMDIYFRYFYYFIYWIYEKMQIYFITEATYQHQYKLYEIEKD